LGGIGQKQKKRIKTRRRNTAVDRAKIGKGRKHDRSSFKIPFQAATKPEEA
jgi:hypothetical protein